jgi:23S rRNA pseudouridine1911/1915/1917 synthase
MNLDEYLVQKYQITRSYAINLLKNGFVSLNGIIVKKRNVIVAESDNVQINIPIYQSQIIWKNDDICVIFKPAGMCVERTYSTPKWYKVVTECVAAQLNFNQVFLIHRLDKETAGLMVVVLNSKMVDIYKEQMDKRMFNKGYKAFYENRDYILKDLNIFNCIHGRMNFKYGDQECLCDTIDYKPIVIHINETKNNVKLNGNKECITLMKEIDGGYDCMLVTGRTHQIRLTMLSLKKPIYGDSIYGKSQDVQMQLFAYYLSFYIL